MEKTRLQLKQYFETGDKPTQEQFADFIDSVFNLVEDGSVAVRDMLQALPSLSRLTKLAVRGADFALNYRGTGNIFTPQYHQEMTNILKGDFWKFNGGTLPPMDVDLSEGDWVVAIKSSLTPSFDFSNETEWMVVNFTDPYTPANYIDFVAMHDGVHYNSNTPLLIPEGDTVKLESRLAMTEAFSKVGWKIYQGETEQRVNARDAEIIMNDAGAFAVELKVYDISGNQLEAKVVDGYITVQSSTLFSVSFLASDYNSDPVPGVRVVFDGVVKYTNASGVAFYGNIESGTYNYSASKNGFDAIASTPLVVSDDVTNSPLAMVLDAYIENEEITGVNEVGETVTADYDFVPAGYEGATEIKWWVEDSEGTEIVAPVTKVKGTHADYNQYLIPEAAAGYILKAEITAYDVQSNTNSNMLKTPFLIIDEIELPAFLGYRTAAQTDPLDSDIITGVDDPTQQDGIDKTLNANYPHPVDVMWMDTFPSLDELTRYDLWFAIPQADTIDEYAYYQNINKPWLTGGYTFDSITTVNVTINGQTYPYEVYVTNQGPNNTRFSASAIS